MMAEVSGTSHADQTKMAARSEEQAQRVKAMRQEITNSQEERLQDLERVVDKERKASDFSDSTKVKISRALNTFLAEAHPKEISHELVDGAIDNTTQREQIKEARKEAEQSSSQNVVNNVSQLKSNDAVSALDNLQKGVHLPTQGGNRIDIYG